MFPLLKAIFGSAAKETDRQREAALHSAIETAVDGTDPRIRGISGYRRKLRPAVECALEYVEHLVAQVPGPVEIGRHTFATDAQVHAFFASPEHIQEVFSRSAALRDFVDHHAGLALCECYALLGMRRTEKTVLGTKMVGDMLRRDVRQIAVNFGDHELIAPAACEEEARKELKERAFANLVELALARIVSLRTRKQGLEERRVLLQAKLRSCKAAGPGLEPLAEPCACDPAKKAELGTRLAEIEGQLEAASADVDTLDDYLTQINHVLGHPQEYLWLDTVSMRLNRMGIKMDPTAQQLSDDITITEVAMKDTANVVIELVKYPTEELAPRQDFRAQAERYLNMRI